MLSCTIEPVLRYLLLLAYVQTSESKGRPVVRRGDRAALARAYPRSQQHFQENRATEDISRDAHEFVFHYRMLSGQ
jgi:hypothetical protein